MTTMVTIKTHSWPVEVTVTDDYKTIVGESVYTARTTTMEPNSEQTLHLSDVRSIAFRELPIPHVSMPPADED